ncbi:unnamed protein product [Vitrella brassicaformis CCMP3155]|uniref:Uncharacterized protein n=1 Tax=Vitrella brassicaformis (strain CCMP3155) TaxID=1169540 RepID=A0A0G4EL50_VITBC|nr:unnamed protein product [Vitrella brassicaformis CCMP3155]|eukprot:CEL97911.1 unnamed protein product [Vitrella brassicaformis CCMP3155]
MPHHRCTSAIEAKTSQCEELKGKPLPPSLANVPYVDPETAEAKRQARQAEADRQLEEMLRQLEEDGDESELEDDFAPTTDYRPAAILRYEAEEAARRQQVEEEDPDRCLHFIFVRPIY